MEKKLRDYIRERIEYVTLPVNYAYGFVTKESIYGTLCEMENLADKVLNDYDLKDRIHAMKLKYYDR